MQGKLTLHYFPLYGRAEPVRMAFWKAGVEFNDNRVGGPDMQALKDSGKLPYGQTPVLEFEDGTTLGQSFAILDYVATVYKLKSDDPVLEAKANSVSQFTWSDALPKVAPFILSKDDDRKEKLAPAIDEWVTNKWFIKVAEFLSDDKKYLTGDTLTVNDFVVAGVLTNLVCNPNSKDPEIWSAAWEKAPDRVKKYYADFCEEMKPYLDARPQDCTM